MRTKTFYIYVLASRPNGAIYIGVTSDLVQRISQHKQKTIKGHTSAYDIDKLVHYEIYADAENAIMREKRLKKWTRAMKNDLISRQNPLWEDLYSQVIA